MGYRPISMQVDCMSLRTPAVREWCALRQRYRDAIPTAVVAEILPRLQEQIRQVLDDLRQILDGRLADWDPLVKLWRDRIGTADLVRQAKERWEILNEIWWRLDWHRTRILPTAAPDAPYPGRWEFIELVDDALIHMAGIEFLRSAEEAVGSLAGFLRAVGREVAAGVASAVRRATATWVPWVLAGSVAAGAVWVLVRRRRRGR